MVVNKRLVAVLIGFMLLASGCWHDIGSFDGVSRPSWSGSSVLGMNDRGDLVGFAPVPAHPEWQYHAFIRNLGTGGDLTDITPLEPGNTSAVAVNRLGIVAGTVVLHGTEPGGAFVWWAFTGLERLPVPPGAFASRAVDINDQGKVLVLGLNATYDWQGSFIWDPGTRTYAELPGGGPGLETEPQVLDEQGGAVGWAIITGANGLHRGAPVAWDPKTLAMHVLPYDEDRFLVANDRNEHGLIVGTAETRDGSKTAVYWPRADALPIELPGEAAWAVNDAGQIVGCKASGLRAPDMDVAAVLWEPARGRTTDLGDKGHGSCARSVDASGRSAGVVGDGNGGYTGAWWDPPPP